MKVEITERHLLLEGFFSKEKIVNSLFFPSLKSVSQGVPLHFQAGFLYSFHSPLTFYRLPAAGQQEVGFLYGDQVAETV